MPIGRVGKWRNVNATSSRVDTPATVVAMTATGIIQEERERKAAAERRRRRRASLERATHDYRSVEELLAKRETTLRVAVQRAILDGMSWAEVADILGTSRQGAHKRFALREEEGSDGTA